VTGVNGMGHIASGHLRVSGRSHVAIVQPKNCLYHLQGSGDQVEVLGASGEGEALEEELVEVVSEAESEGSQTGGWRQEISFALVGIRELLRDQNGYLKRIAQSLDGGLGASENEEDSTIRE